MTIPFNDFQAHYEAVRQVVEPSVQRVLASGWYVLGKEVAAFEEELAAYLGSRYCVGVASGTDAITLALMAAGIGPGDEVITSDMSAYPTITGIERAGATPVVAPIDPASGLLDVSRIETAIGERTRAIVPVHLYGQCCDMERLLALADEKGLPVIEDSAQAIGASRGGRKAGTMGLAGAFSFYPTKNLGAFGDGGAVATDSSEMAERLRELRNYGQRDRYHHEIAGLNSRLDELQAAILRAKLPMLDGWIARRRAIGDRYRQALRGVTPLAEEPAGDSVCHLFVVKAADRDGLQARLKAVGVGTLIHYPVAIHEQPAFSGRAVAGTEETGAFAASILSLPIYPELTDGQVSAVIDAVGEGAM